MKGLMVALPPGRTCRKGPRQALHWSGRMLGGCRKAIALLLAGLGLAGCGTATVASTGGAGDPTATAGAAREAKPQVIEPNAGVQAQTFATTDPVGDPTAHAPPLAEVRRELRLELIYAPVTNASY